MRRDLRNTFPMRGFAATLVKGRPFHRQRAKSRNNALRKLMADDWVSIKEPQPMKHEYADQRF